MIGADPSIGRELAEDRLRRRERRIGQVMRELRTRADAHVAHGDPVPRPLNQALEGFAGELARLRRALGTRGGARPRATRRRTR
jgi:hypothetical protein